MVLLAYALLQIVSILVKDKLWLPLYLAEDIQQLKNILYLQVFCTTNLLRLVASNLYFRADLEKRTP